MTSYSNYQVNNRSNGRSQQPSHHGKKNSACDTTQMHYNNDVHADVYHDHNTNLIFHQRNTQQEKILHSSTTNMHLINSPSPSVRRQHPSDDTDDDFREIMNKKKRKHKQKHNGLHLAQQNDPNVNMYVDCDNTTATAPFEPTTTRTSTSQGDQQSMNDDAQHGPRITNESARYALTRFPFPPYVIRFSSGNVSPKQVKEELTHYLKNNHKMAIEIANCRLSNTKHNNHAYDILLYLKDAISFSFLLDQTHWPSSIGSEKFTFLSSPSIPPQLSLIIKNVDLRIDFEDFCDEVKATYPEIKNVIRMKNKFQNNIKLVKIEVTSPTLREHLLEAKKIAINHITYDIDEYLAPANVLICSKCMGIGHFKKQCLQTNETCKTCGEQCVDLRSHNCSQVEKCIHCQQNHKSNALKCPVIKTFRAELTRKLLSNKTRSTLPTTTIGNNMINNNIVHDELNFPALTPAQVLLNNPMMNKIDNLISKMDEIKNHLCYLSKKHEKFEQFIFEKTQNDERVNQNIEALYVKDNELKKDLLQHDLLIERHENMFTKLLLPILEDTLTFMAAQNQDKKGNPLDADLRSRFDRYRIQVKKTMEAKQCSTK